MGSLCKSKQSPHFQGLLPARIVSSCKARTVPDDAAPSLVVDSVDAQVLVVKEPRLWAGFWGLGIAAPQKPPFLGERKELTVNSLL